MIAYLDLPAGLSGDMFLGCLVDAGWPLDDLQAALATLPVPPGSWTLSAEQVMRGPMRATLVRVEVTEDAQHRSLSDIRQLIEGSRLPMWVQAHAIATFARLAIVEARIHGQPVEQVHFHEVGALDAIVDVVGAAAGLHALGITSLYASPVPLSHGWTDSAHGKIPLPAPATLELLAAAGAPTVPGPGPGELVTPTGAALLAQFATFVQPAMRLTRVGTGAGQRDPAWPNVARLWLGENGNEGGFVELETNLDDMNPELIAAVSQRLFAAGARDVWLTAIQMKKGRPGVLLSVLAPASLEAVMAELMLRETTTLGVRVHAVHRHEAAREFRSVQTAYGPITVKMKRLGGEVVAVMPEFDDCQRVADEQDVPVRVVYEAALASGQTLLAARFSPSASQLSTNTAISP